MTVSSVGNATTTSTGTGTTSNGSQEIAGNFQSFLTLLTTQLQNQSPLDPLDTNQFTEQLVQFASVEQQLKTNDTLTSLLTSAKASTAASAAGLVGANVTADGSTSTLSNGSASWTLTPAKAAAQAVVTIKDSSGTVVATQTQALAAGAQSYAWNGRTSSGGQAPDGSYTLAVSARDAAGQPITVSTEVDGTVSSVDMSGSDPVLLIGTNRVPLSSVTSIGGAAS